MIHHISMDSILQNHSLPNHNSCHILDHLYTKIFGIIDQLYNHKVILHHLMLAWVVVYLECSHSGVLASNEDFRVAVLQAALAVAEGVGALGISMNVYFQADVGVVISDAMQVFRLQLEDERCK